ncbi:multidrug effflux MFS transporter [Ochrobactrum sp. SFR4]|uniref:multidrug effflux MFS transporter n=1 Tax=Ochrobactrum sp. SFR4 TaxID=2717368 RepID=UPI00257027D7|nr:multidrug effflux MFS transporter [Ochrobactrum sp. SFR4]MBX8827369.1 multidrug effflux MFS transporter [Ochrobactrum sp. SFR4]
MMISATTRVAGNLFVASLGLVTVLGPSAIDMYLPSMPQMASDLNTSYASMQLSLTVYLLAQGAGQLVFGPLIDAWGRKWPLRGAIAVFTLASFWAAAAQSFDALLYARFIQGLAASLTLVVAMSSVRDRASGVRAAQIFSLLMAIQGLAPILAPALGGIIAALFGWRAVLAALGILGLLVLVNSAINLAETLPREKRVTLQVSRVARTYGSIVADGLFLMPALTIGAVFFFLFSYVGGAVYVYQTVYALSPDTFGFVFGGTGIAMLFGAIGSGRLVKHFRVETLAIWGAGLILLGALVALASEHTGLGLMGIVTGMTISVLGLGIAEATVISMAMASRETNVGSSVAVLGAFQLISASIATPIAGAMAEVSANSWLVFLVMAGFATVWLTVLSTRLIARSSKRGVDATLNEK